MVDPSAPQDVVELAEERAVARAARDWSTADELKAHIEAAGWRVVDAGTEFTLAPARPADVVEDGHTLYGAVDSVPSLLDEPATAPATVVIIVNDNGSPDTALRAVAAHLPADTQVVVVGGSATVVGSSADEVIRSVEPFTAGNALQAALRRARGEMVVVLESEQVVDGDVVSPLAAALADPTIAIAGNRGLSSVDLHRYRPVVGGDATTLASGCYAFRRADAIERGPVDGQLRLADSVATWLGLLLRDAGSESSPRRAVVVDLSAGRDGDAADVPGEHARGTRRDRYLIADSFGDRPWLASEPPPEGRVVGDGAERHQHDDDTDETGHTREP